MNYTQKSKLIDKLCGAGLMLILVELYYQLIHSAFTEFNYNLADVTKWVYIAGGIILAMSVILLCYAYMKKKAGHGICGIELLTLAITTATIPGCYLEYTAPFNKLNTIYPIAFLVYYIVKAGYIYIAANKEANKFASKKSKKKKR